MQTIFMNRYHEDGWNQSINQPICCRRLRKIKDDFQSVLSAQSTQRNVYSHEKSHSMECESMLLVMSQMQCTLSLSFIDFYSCKVVSSSDLRKNETFVQLYA